MGFLLVALALAADVSIDVVDPTACIDVRELAREVEARAPNAVDGLRVVVTAPAKELRSLQVQVLRGALAGLDRTVPIQPSDCANAPHLIALLVTEEAYLPTPPLAPSRLAPPLPPSKAAPSHRALAETDEHGESHESVAASIEERRAPLASRLGVDAGLAVGFVPFHGDTRARVAAELIGDAAKGGIAATLKLLPPLAVEGGTVAVGIGTLAAGVGHEFALETWTVSPEIWIEGGTAMGGLFSGQTALSVLPVAAVTAGIEMITPWRLAFRVGVEIPLLWLRFTAGRDVVELPLMSVSVMVGYRFGERSE